MMQHRILGAIDVAESTAANVSLNQVTALRQRCAGRQRWRLWNWRRRLLRLRLLRIALLMIELHARIAVLPLCPVHLRNLPTPIFIHSTRCDGSRVATQASIPTHFRRLISADEKAPAIVAQWEPM